MTVKTQTINYQLNELLKPTYNDTTIPQDLAPYCYNNRFFEKPNISQYTDQLKMIISSITEGNDVNERAFKNDVKFYINVINQKNYPEYLKKLSSLDYTTEENIYFLAHELIICGLRCPIAIKGQTYEQNSINTHIKPISEICSELIKHFASFIINDKDDLSFRNELLKICRKFFMDFMNLSKSMDENNENTVDNYKGFMTLLGFMYINNLISTKIILDCIDSIKRNIFCSRVNQEVTDTESTQIIRSTQTIHHDKMFGYKKNYNLDLYNSIIYFDGNITNRLECYRKQIECSNYYKGYEYLMNHVIHMFDTKICELNEKINSYSDNKETDSQKISELEADIKSLIDQLELFILSHTEFCSLNTRFYIKYKDQYISPLKPYILIIHNELGKKLNNILDIEIVTKLCLNVKKYEDVKLKTK